MLDNYTFETIVSEILLIINIETILEHIIISYITNKN
jgi:hypothetical protein